jgi:DNA-binding response OmpR family regulator
MMQCHTRSTRIEILSVEDDHNVVNVIAANLHLEWFRVARSKDGREVARSNALLDLSPREHRLALFPMKNAGSVLTH